MRVLSINPGRTQVIHFQITFCALLLAALSVPVKAQGLPAEDSQRQTLISAPSMAILEDTQAMPAKTAELRLPVDLHASAGASFSPALAPSFVASKGDRQGAHAFFDRANLTGFAIHMAVRAADAAQTCYHLGQGAYEKWLPTQSCAAIAAYSLSMPPAALASSYFLHRSGHHTLERWLPYVWASPSAVGIAMSFK
jgi:hypothetical protein